MQTFDNQQTEQIEASEEPVQEQTQAPSLTQLVQRLASSNKPLQRKAALRAIQYKLRPKRAHLAEQLQLKGEGNDTAHIHELAAQGTQGSGSRLPYFDKVQASFGKHDISQVQAYTGSQAANASAGMGAEAYATGNKVAFASANPSLHTVAHEAAHVIQQQAGVQLKGGVGEIGDHYEQQADQVADAVVQGHSAENILSNYTTEEAIQISVQQQTVQRKMGFEFETDNLLLDTAAKTIAYHSDAFDIHGDTEHTSENTYPSLTNSKGTQKGAGIEFVIKPSATLEKAQENVQKAVEFAQELNELESYIPPKKKNLSPVKQVMEGHDKNGEWKNDFYIAIVDEEWKASPQNTQGVLLSEMEEYLKSNLENDGKKDIVSKAVEKISASEILSDLTVNLRGFLLLLDTIIEGLKRWNPTKEATEGP